MEISRIINFILKYVLFSYQIYLQMERKQMKWVQDGLIRLKVVLHNKQNNVEVCWERFFKLDRDWYFSITGDFWRDNSWEKMLAYDAQIDRETRRILVVRREKLNKSCTLVSHHYNWWSRQALYISVLITKFMRYLAACI
jgi:hypothetical protein